MLENVKVPLEYEKDNKERKPWEYYLEEFKKIDPIEASKRLEVPYDEENQIFKFYLMGSTYYIHYPSFEVTHKEDNLVSHPLEENIYAKILIARLFIEGKYEAFTEEFVSYRDIPWGEFYYVPFSGRCIGRLARKYGNRIDIFEKIMIKIGAEKVNYGDVAYDFKFMNDLYVRFIIWQGDEEFSPSAQILFSKNFASFFNAEDLAYVGDLCNNNFNIVEKTMNK